MALQQPSAHGHTLKLSKFRKKLLIGTALIFGIGTIALLAWLLHLDGIVTKQFEGRRWTLPAQVYAEPLELYAGQSFGTDTLEAELQRLGYQRVDNPQHAGSYRRRGERIDLMSRRFQFWDSLQESQLISVTGAGATIASMTDNNDAEVPIFRLDPLLIGSIFPLHGEDRVVVAPDAVPPLLPAALKVAEDRKFDTHHGVNFLAILRAAIANVRAGQIEQGGSTLTQQLVKSYFLDNRRTLGRKIEEALMAMLLEVHFEKQDLLNAYINEIYLGQDGGRAIHGFGLAAQFYFGKPLTELQPHEIALLVTIVRGPSYYDPRRHPERARVRRDRILQLMADFKVLDAKIAQQAAARPLGIMNGSNKSGYYPAFLDLVRRTLQRDYREEDLTEAGLKIFSTLNPMIQSRAERALEQELDRLEKARKKKVTQKLEGVVVVTAPQNGEVVAMIGGRQASYAGFNRALDAKRSIGSLVKPVIFLAAVESGNFNAASIIEDAPVEVRLANGKLWKPQNITKEFAGPVPLVRALSQSLNLATVNLGLAVGLPQVTQEFTALGLKQEPPQLPSVLLGSLDVAPIDVAQLYNAFANGGFNTPLRAVRSILDGEGKPLKSFALEVTPVADTAAVFQVNQMLVQVMERGTGRGARARLPSGLVVAGKSGTSSDYRDSWFAGFSGSHLGVVWIGYDNNTPTGLTGSSGSLMVWSRLMSNITTTSWSATQPESLHPVTIEYASGLVARPDCGEDVITVAVPQGVQLPTKPQCTGGPRSWWDRFVH